MVSRRLGLLTTTGLFCLSVLAQAAGNGAPQSKGKPADAFQARAKVNVTGAGADAYLAIQIDKYSADADLKAMEEALKAGGSAGFLAALRKSPVVGHIKVGEQTFTIRWARQRTTASGRVISLVTDSPMYFVGGGTAGAKPRAGFDVAVLQLTMDPAGIGQGTMAAAAKVKPGGDTGVEIEDYASEPLKLAVSRVIS